MKKFSILLSILALTLGACASGPGVGPESENGTAALSLQLHGLEEGQIYLTNDGYRLQFSHFALAFSAIRLGDHEVEEIFNADFFDEEVVDVVEIEEVAAGEYDSVTLTLGLEEGDHDHQRFLGASGLKNAETLPAGLSGHSVFLEAEAVNGGQACTLQISLAVDRDIDVESEGQAVEVHGGEEAEILVEVDPNAVFAGVDLAGFCLGGNILTISAAENSGLAQKIAENLGHAMVLGSGEGHDHHH